MSWSDGQDLFLFLGQEASVDNLTILSCSTVVHVMHRAYTALILHVSTPLMPGKGGLIAVLCLDTKSVAEEGTMTAVASADLTVVAGTAAGATNQMKMTGPSLSPQVNAWSSKSCNGAHSWGRVI